MENKIESFINKHNIWREELNYLRSLLHATELEESIKWGMPSYRCNGKNVIGIGAFKNHIGIWFHQGALLSDPNNILINAQKGKTTAMRSIKITKELPINKSILIPYITEAIRNAKDGKEIVPAKPTDIKREVDIPNELQQAFESSSVLLAMFDGLTEIQRFDYVKYIASAKRATTKISRMEKIIPLIQAGKPISGLWKKK